MVAELERPSFRAHKPHSHLYHPSMDVTELDPDDLRMSMLLALDFLVAHRISHDHTYDRARITATRDLLEQRVVRACRLS